MADLDFQLLDRVFQPVSDRMADRASCFDLARFCLAGIVVLQSAVLIWYLQWSDSALVTALIAGATLVQFGAVPIVRRQVQRAERNARPGLLNVQRIVLRPIRLPWFGLAVVSVLMPLTSTCRLVDVLGCVVAWLWPCALYFQSCTPSPPMLRRAGRTLAWAGAGA